MIIGLCGYAGAGKDTVANILVEDLGFTKVAFADPLREMLWILNPIVDDGYGKVTYQQAIERDGWDRAKWKYPEVRRLAQVLGTEVVRGYFGDNFWVETLRRKFAENDLGYRNLVITDVRFPNECALVHEFGGVMVLVDNPMREAGAHATEQLLVDYDMVLGNDPAEGIEALQVKLHSFIKQNDLYD